ncbi:baseplate J/gp47 family protein [Sporomusa acidovorans]|nr:baseplate J/gp47 family protein [Sporomusa acidovorans]
MTYEIILQRMLARVPDTLDKREGSVIYDALSPAALELALMYIELDVNLKLGFADTSNGNYLAMRTTEMGIDRNAAVYALRKGFFYAANNVPMDVDIGARFTIDTLNYIVVEKITTGQFKLQCETAGEIGNIPFGNMVPVEHIDSLVKAELADIITPGEDEETDDSLRDRYHFRVRQPITSGNIYHYKEWAREVAGVGDAKVFPLWNGNGTVKVAIADSDMKPAIPALVTTVAEYIETVHPIGATVTVVSATGKPLVIAAKVILAAGYSLQSVYDSFYTAVQSYLKDIAFDSTYVSYARIGTLLLSVAGVDDYSDLTINGVAGNITLAGEEIPVLGSIDLEV